MRRIIYDVHGNLAEEAKLNYRGVARPEERLPLPAVFNLMEKVAAKYSDYFAVCSESFRDHYVDRGVGTRGSRWSSTA